MVKPCEICGDIGWIDLIKVCCRCKITREHPYCMKVCHDGDPEEWVCVECELGDQIPSLKPNISFAYSLPDIDPCVPSKQPNNTPRYNIRKPPQNTKVHYITPEEAMGLKCGLQKRNLSSPSKSNLSCRPTKNRTPPPKSEAIRCTTTPPKHSVKSHPHDNSAGFTKLQSTGSPLKLGTPQDKTLSEYKDTEKHLAQRQSDKQDLGLAIGWSAKQTRTLNATSEQRNKGPVQPWCPKFPASKSSPGKSVGPNAKRDNLNLERFSRQLVQGLPVENLDKEPVQPWCLKFPASKLSPGKSVEPNAKRNNLNLGHFSRHLVQGLPVENLDKRPAQYFRQETPSSRLSPGGSSKPNAERDHTNSGQISAHLVLPAEISGKGPARQLWRETPASKLSPNTKNSEPNKKGENMNYVHASQIVQGLPAASSDKGLAQPMWRETPTFKSSPGKDFKPETERDHMYSGHSSRQLAQGLSAVSSGKEPARQLRREIPASEASPSEKIFKPNAGKESFNSGQYSPQSVQGWPVVSSVPKSFKCASAEPTVEELTPVREECVDGTNPVLRLATTYQQEQMEFQRDLQKCVDRFFMLKQPEQVNVKAVAENPGSK